MIRQESKALLVEHEYDDSVADFLRQSPDFFERNPELLMELSVPHHERGSISLVEKRLSLHREQYRELRSRLEGVVEIAQHNDELGELLHEYAIGLMNASSIKEVFNYTWQTLAENMNCEIAKLLLYRNDVIEACTDDAPDYVKLIGANFGRSIREMHSRRGAYCGYASAERRRMFFPEITVGSSSIDIQSLAVLQLGSTHDTGYLVLGSQQKTRFAPHKGTDFLVRFGSLLGARLAVFYN